MGNRLWMETNLTSRNFYNHLRLKYFLFPLKMPFIWNNGMVEYWVIKAEKIIF